MYKILVVEDDPIIAQVMQQTLQNWGYQVDCVTDFKGVLNTFIAAEPQLVLLDISLPYYSGFYWCGEIRKVSKVPILFISSAADSMNMVMAMNLGADDFIAKPFDLGVFVAKIQAIMRRTYDYVGQTNFMSYAGVMLNLTDATLRYGDSQIELTKNDFKTLQVLMENPTEIISRSAIMTKLWESDSFIDDNTLTVNMTRLKKKLEEIGLKNFIVTKKGVGYRVNTPEAFGLAAQGDD